MSITIKNKNSTIQMGYYNFYRLRTNIASLYSKEFATFFQNYSNGEYTEEETAKKLTSFKNVGTLSEEDNCVVDFLLLSEVDGKISPKHCRKLYQHIKNYDDNTQYGKASRQVSFDDFKKLVHECAKNRWTLKWS